MEPIPRPKWMPKPVLTLAVVIQDKVFSTLKIDPKVGVVPHPSRFLSAEYDRTEDRAMRIRRRTDFGDWLEVTRQNRAVGLQPIDRLLGNGRLVTLWKQWTSSWRTYHLSISRRKTQSAERTVFAEFNEHVVYRLVWSDQQNYIAGVIGDPFKWHRLVGHHLQPIMPNWLIQLLLTSVCFASQLSVIWLLDTLKRT
jgi:hypothetical protein